MKEKVSASEKELLEENARLRKENKALKTENEALQTENAAIKKKAREEKASLKKELKKKDRANRNTERRTKTISLEPIPRHSFNDKITKLCTLIYERTPCGLRTTVQILEIFNEVFDGLLGEPPSYVTVLNWIKKYGLSVYEDEKPRAKGGTRKAAVADESISVFKEKLLVLLEIPAEHLGRPLRLSDVSVIWMGADNRHTSEDVKNAIEQAEAAHHTTYENFVTDQGTNLVKGVNEANKVEHYDISHYLGNCVKHVYWKEADFKELMDKIAKLRLRYQLTDKHELVPPNMRAISRFMNMDKWVRWAYDKLMRYDTLDKESQEALAFLLQ